MWFSDFYEHQHSVSVSSQTGRENVTDMYLVVDCRKIVFRFVENGRRHYGVVSRLTKTCLAEKKGNLETPGAT